MKISMSASSIEISNPAIFFLIKISSPRLRILAWLGFYLRIKVISAPNLPALWDTQHLNMLVKVDDYSYVVVVLEIISCRKSTDQSKDADEYLLKQAWKLYENDMHKDLVDETLDPSEYKEEEIKKVIEITLMCTQSTAASRPTMSQVVVLLKSKGILDHKPVTAPTFVDTNNRIREDTSTSTGSTASKATASISQLSAR